MHNTQKPEAVGDILDRLLKKLEIDKKIEEQRALGLWAQAAGENLARFTRAASVVRGRMTVECQSPVWANECRLLKPAMIEKINRALGREIIKDITFRVADIKPGH